MPESENIVYAASCNPPRRAKRLSIASSTTLDNMPATTQSPLQGPKPIAILPKRTSSKAGPTHSTTDGDSVQQAPVPAKRGRKPGPLSRSAREAQRRLNHSIIEKARRTKINDALATLRQLVPADFGQPKSTPADTDLEDEDDDYREVSKKPKKAGKKEEKEKEFKLEILVRTVSYMQELLNRVATLEEGTQSSCQKCLSSQNRSSKRRHSEVESDEEEDRPSHVVNRRRRLDGDNREPSSANDTAQSTFQPHTHERLPPIASWLLDSNIDPNLLPGKTTSQQSHTRTSPTYLPSPPSSTHFDPVRPAHVPPTLNLGPVASAAIMSNAGSSASTTTIITTGTSPSSTMRTPEDESAASLLLQISTSSLRPVSASSPSTTMPSYGLSDPSKSTLHMDYRSNLNVKLTGRVMQAQTPGSLLGLNHVRTQWGN